MPKVLVIYDSRSGHTKKAAELIAEGVRKAAEIEVEIKRVDDVSTDDVGSADTLSIGCPTHMFTASRKMKRFLSRKEISDSLRGKKGAAFTSCRFIPRAINWLKGKMGKLDMEIVDSIAVHGMVQGDEAEACKSLGERIAGSAREISVET